MNIGIYMEGLVLGNHGSHFGSWTGVFNTVSQIMLAKTGILCGHLIFGNRERREKVKLLLREYFRRRDKQLIFNKCSGLYSGSHCDGYYVVDYVIYVQKKNSEDLDEPICWITHDVTIIYYLYDVPRESYPGKAEPVPFPHFPDRLHAYIWRN